MPSTALPSSAANETNLRLYSFISIADETAEEAPLLPLDAAIISSPALLWRVGVGGGRRKREGGAERRESEVPEEIEPIWAV